MALSHNCITSYLYAFLEDQESRGQRESIVHQKEQELLQFIAFKHGQHVFKLETQDIQYYLNKTGLYLKETLYNRRVRTIKQFYTYLVHNKTIASNPAKNILFRKKKYYFL